MHHVTEPRDDAQVGTRDVAMKLHGMALGVRDAVIGAGDEPDRDPQFTVTASQARRSRNH